MNETIVDCLDKKAKTRFMELNSVMANTLRDEIIRDVGHPKLKAKCLDLIHKLRLEANILNVSKTGKADPSKQIDQPKLTNIKNFDDNGKEVLGVDENG